MTNNLSFMYISLKSSVKCILCKDYCIINIYKLYKYLTDMLYEGSGNILL